MTDLEMTRLCAKAIGWSDIGPEYNSAGHNLTYDPFHDDAQAMALVKKFNLWIRCDRGSWSVCNADNELEIYDRRGSWFRNDLNRAIVEWAAAWQQDSNLKKSA